MLPVTCDVTDPEQVEQGFQVVEQQLGPVEILIANAGITQDGLLLRMSEESWRQVLDVNLTGTFRLVKRVSKAMLRARFGRMVLLSSVVAMLGSAGQVNYAASKAGLIGMARSITRELGSRNITCNVVAPGFIQTAMTDVLDEKTKAGYLEQIPLRRMGSVDDIAKVVRFLVSEDASYNSGAVIPVDGGLGMGH